jgi:NADH-quinone oxidoreductase subunit J
LAGLFVLLHAFFLAAVQVLVYAGAVMVLFLFVIMLLDLRAEERRRIKTVGVVLGLISVGAIAAIFFQSLLHSPIQTANPPSLEGSTVPLGKLLFTRYLLPFEMVSVLLLVAMVGVILLSKKEVN